MTPNPTHLRLPLARGIREAEAMIAYIKVYILGYRKTNDPKGGYWYHKDWKGKDGWQDRPWLDTPEECLEYEAITSQ